MRKWMFVIVIIAGTAMAAAGVGILWTMPWRAMSRPSTAAETPVLKTPQAATKPAQPPRKIHILIVPGHEPTSGGTSFRGVYERDLTVQLGQELDDYLKADPRFDVTMTRNAKGWNPVIADYLSSQKDAIVAWRDAAKKNLNEEIASGAVSLPVGAVSHNDASPAVSEELYGITKWADENGIDLMVHIHFNNDRWRQSWAPGKYSGLAMYVPSLAYGNGAATRPVARVMFDRLTRFDPASDFPPESAGIIDEPRLIAVGEDDTATEPSMLIEYGYIYEQRFIDAQVRDLAVRDLAYQTYEGLRTYYRGLAPDPSPVYGTVVLPHRWKTPMTASSAGPVDVFALQTALVVDKDGPAGDPAATCPRTGVFDACTRSALAQFQKKHDITGERDTAGPATIAALNAAFGNAN